MRKDCRHDQEINLPFLQQRGTMNYYMYYLSDSENLKNREAIFLATSLIAQHVLFVFVFVCVEKLTEPLHENRFSLDSTTRTYQNYASPLMYLSSFKYILPMPIRHTNNQNSNKSGEMTCVYRSEKATMTNRSRLTCSDLKLDFYGKVIFPRLLGFGKPY